LKADSNDKRLIRFVNISHRLQAIGVQNGDILVFLNDKNVLQPPVALSLDRVKAELTALRRNHPTIRIGVCRTADRSLLNKTTIEHLGSFTFEEFQQIAAEDQLTPSLNESRKSLPITASSESKRRSHFFSSKKKITTTTTTTTNIEQHSKSLPKKKSSSPNRDSGFIETDGTNTSMLTDRSVRSNSHKLRSKSSLEKSEEGSIDTHKSLDSLRQSSVKINSEIIEQNKPSAPIYANVTIDKSIRRSQRAAQSQAVTDACYIYRRQVTKPDTSEQDAAAMILRGREIALEAANAPTIPVSMPNYTRDQIRELYGELDKKTRRLQSDEYTIHTQEKPQWKLAAPIVKGKVVDECPLPKFRLENSPDPDEALLMAAYLSTGLSNPRSKAVARVDTFHTVMMNASAKVNEWATSNEIYLAPDGKELVRGSFHTTVGDRPSVSPSPLLLDVRRNLKQLAGTPTGAQDRPTSLGGITSQENFSSNNGDHGLSITTDDPYRSFRRQDQLLDTASSSPDSLEIALETTPSTPGSCGMYLEPYMRQGYDLPCVDQNVRDSSWQHQIDQEDTEGTIIISDRGITPMESPTTPKIESPPLISPPSVQSQITDGNSLIDMDDGTTISYHTAKESRHDQQSTLSVGSDDTTSTLHQHFGHDDLINTIVSPEDSFYFDAVSSVHHQQAEKSEMKDPSVDHLKHIVEEIESSNKSEESNSEQPSPHGIHQLITIVDDIHHYSETTPSDDPTTDNLLFVYEQQIADEQSPLEDYILPSAHPQDRSDSCVNNLLFLYDETLTPTDERTKPVTHESDEWSYDNLLVNDQQEDEDVSTDNLGTIVHEALAARFQKPIHIKSIDQEEEQEQEQMEETPSETDHLGMMMHDVLSVRSPQKSVSFKITDNIDQIPMETDNLGTIVHEALAARFQKRIHLRDVDLDATPPVETDNLGTIIHEALNARFQKPIQIKSMEESIDEGIYHVEHSPDQSETQEIDNMIDPLEIPEEEDRLDPLTSSIEQPDEVTETLVVEIETENPSVAPPVSHLSQIISDSLLNSANYQSYQLENNERKETEEIKEMKERQETNETLQVDQPTPQMFDEEIYEEYGYRRTVTEEGSDDVVEKFEELCRRYTTSLDQYQTTTEQLDRNINEFETKFQRAEQEDDGISPLSETTSEELITTIERVVDKKIDEEPILDQQISNEFCVTVDVQRQPDQLGKYGFELKEEIRGKVQIASISNPTVYPNLSLNDELILINNDQTFDSLDQCQGLLNTLWEHHYENVQITVIKSVNIPTLATSEPVSLQSSSLSWPLSIVE